MAPNPSFRLYCCLIVSLLLSQALISILKTGNKSSTSANISFIRLGDLKSSQIHEKWMNRQKYLESTETKIKYNWNWYADWSPHANEPKKTTNCRYPCNLLSAAANSGIDAELTLLGTCTDHKELVERKKKENQILFVNMNIEPFAEDQYQVCSNSKSPQSFVASALDMAMSYSTNSTIMTTYYDATRVPVAEYTKDVPPVHQRKKGACVFVSNCGGPRLDFLKRLGVVYPLRSFGKCLHNEDTNKSKQDTLKHCKYSLSFESFSLPFYMTEKIFDSLKSKTLTIYKGAPNVEDLIPLQDLPIINANSMSPEELGKLLISLDEHDEKYKAYFEKFEKFEKDSPKSNEFLENPKLQFLRQHAFDNNICSICTAVAEMKFARTLFNSFLKNLKENEEKFSNPFPETIPFFKNEAPILKISEAQMKQFLESNSSKLSAQEKALLWDIYDHAFARYWRAGNELSSWNDVSYFLKKK